MQSVGVEKEATHWYLVTSGFTFGRKRCIQLLLMVLEIRRVDAVDTVEVGSG